MTRLGRFRHRYRSEPDFHLAVSLRVSFGVHLLYVLYKGAMAIWYHSAWFGAAAGYYLALSAAQFYLLRRAGKGRTVRQNCQIYRVCGAFLLFLTSAIGAVAFYTLRDAQAVVYPWHLIYGAAAYTFYSLTMALIWVIRLRKNEDLLLRAAKCFSLSAALVALFSLQTALLAAFGDGAVWEQSMNFATALGVFLLVAVLAFRMLRYRGKVQQKTA